MACICNTSLDRKCPVHDLQPVAAAKTPYCAKLAGPCPDRCAAVPVKPGELHGDCWRVKPPPVSGVGVAHHKTFCDDTPVPGEGG